MKYQEVKKILGITVAAGALSLSACANKEVEAPAPAAIATPAPTEAPTPTPTPTPIVEEIEVVYENSATETDVLEIVDNEPVSYIVKDYEPLIFFDTLLEANFPFSYDTENNVLLLNDAVCSEYCEIVDTLPNDGEATEAEPPPAETEETEAPKPRYLLVKEVDLGAGLGEYAKPAVKYLKTGDNEATALYIEVTKDETVNSGITFVFSMTEANDIELVGILGIFDEDLTMLKVYEGAFSGYALTPDGDIAYQASDELLVSAGINLYPIFSFETTEIEEIDGKEVYQIGKGPNGGYYLKDADGNITIMSSKTGKNVDKDKVKEVQDNKNKKDKDTTKKDKTDKDTTKKDKDKTGDKSADESKPKPDTSNDGGNKVTDDYNEQAALDAWAAAGVTINGANPGALDSLAGGTVGRWE